MGSAQAATPQGRRLSATARQSATEPSEVRVHEAADPEKDRGESENDSGRMELRREAERAGEDGLSRCRHGRAGGASLFGRGRWGSRGIPTRGPARGSSLRRQRRPGPLRRRAASRRTRFRVYQDAGRSPVMPKLGARQCSHTDRRRPSKTLVAGPGSRLPASARADCRTVPAALPVERPAVKEEFGRWLGGARRLGAAGAGRRERRAGLVAGIVPRRRSRGVGTWRSSAEPRA